MLMVNSPLHVINSRVGQPTSLKHILPLTRRALDKLRLNQRLQNSTIPDPVIIGREP